MKKAFLLILILSAPAYGYSLPNDVNLCAVIGFDANALTYDSLDFNDVIPAPIYETIYIGVYSDYGKNAINWLSIPNVPGYTFEDVIILPAAGDKAKWEYTGYWEGYDGLWWYLEAHEVDLSTIEIDTGLQFVLPITITEELGVMDIILWDAGGETGIYDSIEVYAPGTWPTHQLTIAVEPNNIGISTITPSVGTHDRYFQVSLSARPYLACPDVWRFDHWDGNDIGNVNLPETYVVMNSDKIITAYYIADKRVCGDECHPILQGDLNKDCRIDMADFAIYAAEWCNCTHPDCD